jgi:hypothetical protein
MIASSLIESPPSPVSTNRTLAAHDVAAHDFAARGLGLGWFGSAADP